MTTTEIHVRLPAQAVYLRYARVTAATLADDAGLDVDGIDRLRIAVDELCALAISDAVDGADLDLTLSFGAGSLHVRGVCSHVEADPEIDPIAKQLLDRGVDEHSLTREGDTVVFSLTKTVAAS